MWQLKHVHTCGDGERNPSNPSNPSAQPFCRIGMAFGTCRLSACGVARLLFAGATFIARAGILAAPAFVAGVRKRQSPAVLCRGGESWVSGVTSPARHHLFLTLFVVHRAKQGSACAREREKKPLKPSKPHARPIGQYRSRSPPCWPIGRILAEASQRGDPTVVHLRARCWTLSETPGTPKSHAEEIATPQWNQWTRTN